MEVTTKLRYLRIAPRKVRLVADLIRGSKVEAAKTKLEFLTKKAAIPMLKLLNSAIANAKNNFQLDKTNLYISKIFVDEGPKLKRWRARARGVSGRIQKKTSHIILTLSQSQIEKKPKRVKRIKRRLEEEKAEAKEKKIKISKPKFRPEMKIREAKKAKGMRKFFRRKAFG